MKLTATIERLQGLLKLHNCSMSTEQLEAVECHMKMAAKKNIVGQSNFVPLQDCRVSYDETISNSDNFSPLLRDDMQYF